MINDTDNIADIIVSLVADFYAPEDDVDAEPDFYVDWLKDLTDDELISQFDTDCVSINTYVIGEINHVLPNFDFSSTDLYPQVIDEIRRRIFGI